MQASFLLLALTNTALLVLTNWTGYAVEGTTGFSRHFLLGMLAAFFTCFVHIVAFVYFIVQDKIIKQSVMLDGLDPAYAARVDRHKVRVLAASMSGIVLVLIVSTLGAVSGGERIGWWHGAAGLAQTAINVALFNRQYGEIGRYRQMFVEAFGGA